MNCKKILLTTDEAELAPKLWKEQQNVSGPGGTYDFSMSISRALDGVPEKVEICSYCGGRGLSSKGHCGYCKGRGEISVLDLPYQVGDKVVLCEDHEPEANGEPIRYRAGSLDCEADIWTGAFLMDPEDARWEAVVREIEPKQRMRFSPMPSGQIKRELAWIVEYGLEVTRRD